MILDVISDALVTFKVFKVNSVSMMQKTLCMATLSQWQRWDDLSPLQPACPSVLGLETQDIDSVDVCEWLELRQVHL